MYTINLQVFSGHKNFKRVAVIKIINNRIVNVHAKYARKPSIEKRVLKLSEEIEHKDDIDFKYSIRKLDFGEFAYRNNNLTYQLISEGMIPYFEDDKKMYIKPTFLKTLYINYHLKNYFWQKEDLKQSTIKHIINNIISLIIGGLVGYLIASM